MIVPPNYTPVQITVPDDKDCSSIYYRWKNIYRTNKDDYSYISHIYLARRYNLIYAFIKTDNLKLLRYPYTVIPTSSAENIEFYKLDNFSELILKEENNIQEIVTFDGTKLWYKYGKRHRDNDLPAIIYDNGLQFWFKNGKLHRDNDSPSLIHPNGTQEWYKNGKLHRDNDLPAVIETDGSKLWYKHGEQYANPS